MVKKFYNISEVELFTQLEFFVDYFDKQIINEASDITIKEIEESLTRLKKPVILVISKNDNEYSLTFIDVKTQVERKLVVA